MAGSLGGAGACNHVTAWLDNTIALLLRRLRCNRQPRCIPRRTMLADSVGWYFWQGGLLKQTQARYNSVSDLMMHTGSQTFSNILYKHASGSTCMIAYMQVNSAAYKHCKPTRECLQLVYWQGITKGMNVQRAAATEHCAHISKGSGVSMALQPCYNW